MKRELVYILIALVVLLLTMAPNISAVINVIEDPEQPVQTEDTFTGAEADQQMRISTGYVTPIEENMPSEHLTPDITSQGESTAVSDQSQGQSTEPPVKPTETIKTLEGSSINPY